jgi:hypothetical protein
MAFQKIIDITDGQETALQKLADHVSEKRGIDPALTAEQFFDEALSQMIEELRGRYIGLRKADIAGALAAADNATLVQVEALLGL